MEVEVVLWQVEEELWGGGAAMEVEPPVGALDHNPVQTGNLGRTELALPTQNRS